MLEGSALHHPSYTVAVSPLEPKGSRLRVRGWRADAAGEEESRGRSVALGDERRAAIDNCEVGD